MEGSGTVLPEPVGLWGLMEEKSCAFLLPACLSVPPHLMISISFAYIFVVYARCF